MAHHKRVVWEFNCPRCGSHYFGTVAGPNPKDYWNGAEGHCNGDGDNSCKFKWPRSEDWLYFSENVTTKFDSKEAYDVAKNRAEGPYHETPKRYN
jgi:hypothetical protein